MVEIRRGKNNKERKKEGRKERQDKNMSASATEGGHNQYRRTVYRGI